MDLILDDSDLDFYLSLPDTEKFIFLYDLLCTDSYMSSENDEFAMNDLPVYESKHVLTSFNEEDLLAFETKISTMVESSINVNINVNVLILSNIIIVNADDDASIIEAVTSFAISGVILTELQLKERLYQTFRKKNSCRVYFIIGSDRKIQLN